MMLLKDYGSINGYQFAYRNATFKYDKLICLAIRFIFDASGNVGYRTGMTDPTGSTSWQYDTRGTTKFSQGTSPTDYGYTGQRQEGDIYYYGARWPKVPEAELKGFDPSIGRFMQADTIVPLQTGSVTDFV